MSEQLKAAFAKAEERGRSAFVSFVTAGYPSLDETVDVMTSMQKGGADVIELGTAASLTRRSNPLAAAHEWRCGSPRRAWACVKLYVEPCSRCAPVS